MAEYFLGVDIGDGETSVAMLTESMVTPLMVDLGYKHHSILSAVGNMVKKEAGKSNGHFQQLTPDEIVIGENVLLSRNVTDRRIRFKSQFLNGGADEDIRRFVIGLHNAIRKYSGLSEQDGVIHYVVGCPTGAKWTESKRMEYAELIRRGLPVKKMPVGESRAAFLYTVYSGAVDVPPELLKQSVLVVDMGSSTTDLAYVVHGKDETKAMKEFGEAFLGGGMIDEAILNYCVSQNKHAKEIRALFEREPSIKSSCEFSARKVKEQYFNALIEKRHTKCSRREIVYYGKTAAVYTSLDLTVDDQVMETVLNQKLKGSELSFLQTFDSLLESAVKMTEQVPPKLILIAGGASRMCFVREHISRYFPDAMITACAEPEFAIAKGLAFACRVDHRMNMLRDEVMKLTNTLEFDTELDRDLPRLVRSLCKLIVPRYINNVFLPTARKINSEQAMREELEVQADDFFSSAAMTVLINKEITEWMKDSMTKFKENIVACCLKYGVSHETMPVPSAETVEFCMPPVAIHFFVRLLMAIPGIGKMVIEMMRSHYIDEAWEQMQKDMLDRSGTFYSEFRQQIKACIREEIDQRAKEVEIPVV